MIVDHADNERYAFNCVGKPHDLDVDVPRLLELSRQPLDTVHDLFKGTRKRILWCCGLDCGSAGSDYGGVQDAVYQWAFSAEVWTRGRMDKPVLKLVSISTSAK